MFIKSPIHYMGNKFDLLPKIIEQFPKKEEISAFYDVFGGSGTVSLNVSYDNVIYNELNDNMVNLLKMIKNENPDVIFNHINKRIKKFDLNPIGTDIRSKDTSDEVRQYYNKKYLKFREYYNNSKERDIKDLYTLSFYSFCNLMRFNSKNEFNMPYGNRCYLLEEDSKRLIDAHQRFKEKNITLLCGNSFELLKTITKNENQFMYFDPPYCNSTAIYNENRAFGGSRTFHRIACAIEDAGFTIRDTIMWLYGSGFPKSLNIGYAVDKKMGVESIELENSPNARPSGNKDNNLYKLGTVGKNFKVKIAQNEWSGWGTQLKPAYEPIIVAQKPVEKSIVENVMKYGVGGINIDECRVENTQADDYDLSKRQISKATGSDNDGHFLDELHNKDLKHGVIENGRFPANVILTYDETDFEEVCGGMPDTKSTGSDYNFESSSQDNITHLYTNIKSGKHFEDNGNASRYFYCAKASQFDRDEGLEELESKKRYQQGNYSQSPVCSVCGKTFNGTNDHSQCGEHTMVYKTKEENMSRKNIHPTVKPCDLMRYLVRLVSPKSATILDCFNGSGSTGKAVMLENKQYNKDYKYIGIELTDEYLPIAKARIEYIINNDFDFSVDDNGKSDYEVVKKDNRLTIFDFDV